MFNRRLKVGGVHDGEIYWRVEFQRDGAAQYNGMLHQPVAVIPRQMSKHKSRRAGLASAVCRFNVPKCRHLSRDATSRNSRKRSRTAQHARAICPWLAGETRNQSHGRTQSETHTKTHTHTHTHTTHTLEIGVRCDDYDRRHRCADTSSLARCVRLLWLLFFPPLCRSVRTTLWLGAGPVRILTIPHSVTTGRPARQLVTAVLRPDPQYICMTPLLSRMYI